MTQAKPRFRIDSLVFWFVVLTALPALGWHYGFEDGFEKGRSTANGVCKITCEERKE